MCTSRVLTPGPCTSAIAPYTNHDANEHVTMEAARLVGLSVSRNELITTGRGHRVFVSTRYDRRQANGRWARLHQEDLCQALSVAPSRKYQQDGGPGVNQIAGLFDRLAGPRDQADSRRRFFDALGLPELLKAAAKLRIPADVAADRVRYIRSNLAAAFADAANTTTATPEVRGYAVTVANSINDLVATRGWA